MWNIENEEFLLDIQTKCGDITNQILNAVTDTERTFKCKWPRDWHMIIQSRLQWYGHVIETSTPKYVRLGNLKMLYGHWIEFKEAKGLMGNFVWWSKIIHALFSKVEKEHHLAL